MKRIVIIIGIIAAIVIVAMISLRVYTKSFSPEAVASYEHESLDLSIKYCRPSAKGRAIFGEVIPYGEVWRTGANEATIFNNNAELQIGGQTLAAGSYSLFTIPDKDEWQIIFNKETGQWGVDPMKGGVANRDPELDAMTITVPAIYTEDFFETFTIAFEGMGNEIELVMMWENTMIVVPMVASNL